MNNTNPLVSIIVPVYKVERYIHRSIDSLLRQTYNNLEIILVDDGSPDNCPFICDKYAMQDNRIRVIHKSNGGLSDARNAALNVMTGQYVTFVDSDDYIADNMIEKFIETVKQQTAFLLRGRWGERIQEGKEFSLLYSCDNLTVNMT